MIHHQHQTQYWKHITNVAVQGGFVHIWETLDVYFEWKADIYGLPTRVAKFLLNSVLKSLPTKDNLHKWDKLISEACDLCGDWDTITHVHSGCKLMLDQAKYTWHHDSILNKITEFVNQVNDSNLIINVDLGEKPWTIPPDLLVTSDRPDLVVIDNIKIWIWILELTVPFENNVNRNHEYKCHKYGRLCIDHQRLCFNVKYFAIEIGCRAVISDNNSKCLYAFYKSIRGLKFNNRDFWHLKMSFSKTVITSSFVIFK